MRKKNHTSYFSYTWKTIKLFIIVINYVCLYWSQWEFTWGALVSRRATSGLLCSLAWSKAVRPACRHPEIQVKTDKAWVHLQLVTVSSFFHADRMFSLACGKTYDIFTFCMCFYVKGENEWIHYFLVVVFINSIRVSKLLTYFLSLWTC